MTSNVDDDKLNTLKTEVRCTLISTKEGLTLKDFLRDYKETVGKPFPFLPYGYRTPLDFLKSMPDIVTIVKPCGSPELLMPVEDKKSAHINKLTLGQKRSKKGFGRPRPVQLPNDNKNRITTPAPKLPVPHRPSTTLRGWESPRLEPNYHNAPVQNSNNGRSWLSKPLAMPITPTYPNNQPQPLMSINANGGGPQFQQSREQYSPPYRSQQPIKMITHNVIDINKIFSHGRQDLSPTKDVSDSTSSALVEQDLIPENNEPTQEGNNKQDDDLPNGVDSVSMCSRDDDDNDDFDDRYISGRMKDNFKSILNEHPNGILASKFPVAYQKKYGVPLNQNDLGFQSIKEIVTWCSDVFKIHKLINQKDWLLFGASSTVIPEDDCSKWIPDHVLDNMQELAEKFPNGLSSSEILTLYEEHFQMPLNYKKMGFESLTSFLVNCNSIECKTEEDLCFIFPINVGKSDVIAPELDDNTTDPYLSFENAEFLWKPFFEEYVCDPKFKYEEFKLNEDKIMKVLVCDAVSPEVVWLQNAATGQLLGDLMFKLNNFYDDEEENFKMNDRMIMPNVACCVKYNPVNRWHRGLIYPPIDNDEVKVLYIDYGTTAFVKKSELRTLHRQFAKLPIQAIKSKLFGIKPANKNGWTDEGKTYLFEIALENIFIAQIMEVHPETQSIEVILCDTSGPEDVIINEELIKLNYACSISTPYTDKDLTSEGNYKNMKSICVEESPSRKLQTQESSKHFDNFFDSKSTPECFVKLLPPWLSITDDWGTVSETLQQAENTYSKEEHSTHKKSLGAPPSCCTHHLLSHLFVKQPKVICENWAKIMDTFDQTIEQTFLRILSSELKIPLNLKKGPRLCYPRISYVGSLKAEEDIKEKRGEEVDSGLISCQNTRTTETSVTGLHNSVNREEDKEKHLRSSKIDCSAIDEEPYVADKDRCIGDSKECINGDGNKPHRKVRTRVIELKIEDKSIHFVRHLDKVYISTDEIITLLAKSIPRLLVNHRLWQDQELKKSAVVIRSDSDLYKELLAKKVINRIPEVSLVPLALARDIIYKVDVLQKPVADLLKKYAAEFTIHHRFWYE